MIKKINLQLGCGLYTGGGKEMFHKLFMEEYEHGIIFQCPTQGETLINCLFNLKNDMWNAIDSLDWKDEE